MCRICECLVWVVFGNIFWQECLTRKSIVNYCKITLNKCYGNFPEMSIGKEFYAPEFEVKARENTKAKLPIKEINFVDKLPE